MDMALGHCGGSRNFSNRQDRTPQCDSFVNPRPYGRIVDARIV